MGNTVKFNGVLRVVMKRRVLGRVFCKFFLIRKKLNGVN